MMELNLEGVIGYDIFPNKVREFLQESSGEDVLLLINSPGGDAYDAVAIHSILKEYPGNVTARVQGLAASGASLLIMAADRIEMCVGALLMIHEPSADFLGYRGTADTHRRAADALDVTTAAVAKIYVNRSGQREKQVLGWMRDETWFGPDDAVSSGLADEIYDDAPEVEPFPANYAAVFSNTPANLAQLCHVKGWDKLRREMKMTQAKTKPKQDSKPKMKSLEPRAQNTIQAERDRVSELFTLAHQTSFSDVVDEGRLERWIREGVTVEQAKIWMMSAKVAIQGDDTICRPLDGLERRPPYTTGMSYDQGSGLVEKVADGFLAGLDKTHKPTLGREFAGVSMVDIADVVLHANGSRPPMFGGRSAKIEMAMGTNDFPLILGSAMNRMMLNNYESAASGIKTLSREVEVSDFRTRHSLKLSIGPDLEKVLEGGEYKSGSLSEGDETFAAETYGKILALTRQAMVNDDKGAFDNMARIMGQGAAQTEAKLFAILTKNAGNGPTTADGDTLFHANHGNEAASAGAISVATLGDAQVAMMRQSGLAGEVIKVIPMFLLVPPELKVIAEQLLTTITASDTASVNPFAGQLTLIVDPYLTDPNRWYVTSTPGNPDALQHAYLDGQAGPEIFTQEGFEIDAVQFKCRLDFGAGFVDHRAWYTNAGV